MIRIAVCDDEPVLARAALQATKNFFDNNKPIELKCEYRYYTNPITMINEHERTPFDVAIIDIEMPELSGLDCAELMRNYYSKTEIIFVTCHSEYVDASFELGAFWFCKKSLEYEDLELAIKKLLTGERRALYIKPESKPKTESIHGCLNETVYYTAARNCVEHHMINSIKTEYTSLNTIELTVPFCYRINRNTVVNFYYVKNITKNEVILFDGKKLRLSIKYSKKILDDWKDYIFDSV